MEEFETEKRHKDILNNIKKKWHAKNVAYNQRIENIKKKNEMTYRKKARELKQKLAKKEEILKACKDERNKEKAAEKQKLIDMRVDKERVAKQNVDNYLIELELKRLQVENETKLKSKEIT